MPGRKRIATIRAAKILAMGSFDLLRMSRIVQMIKLTHKVAKNAAANAVAIRT
jgi:hypothetical protein